MIKRILISTLLALGAAWSASPPWHWYYYTLDSTGNAIGYSKLRYDKDGALKIAYRSGYDVMYGIVDEKASAFRVMKADTGLGSHAKIDMTLDEDGNPHIIHHDYLYQRLMYAYYDGKAWKHFDADTLAHPTSDFYQINILIDSKGVKHLTYTTSKDRFNTMTYSSLGTDFKRLDKFVFTDLGTGGKWNSMVFDKDENLVLSYFTYGKSGLVLGTRASDGKWTCNLIPKDANYPHEGFYANMKRSGDDYFIVAHQRDAEGNANGVKRINLLTGKPGDTAWTIGKIDTLAGYTQYGTQTPIIIGKDGEPIVIIPKVKPKDEFYAESADLHIAWRKDSTWEWEVIDTLGITGLYADMVATPEGLPAVTYFEEGKKVLRLAIARSEAPKDANGNGIPDYQETPLQHVGLKRPARMQRKAVKARGTDALGRKAPVRSRAAIILPQRPAPDSKRNAER